MCQASPQGLLPPVKMPAGPQIIPLTLLEALVDSRDKVWFTIEVPGHQQGKGRVHREFDP
eukprot:9426887-Alexandrium_andersonii.AAC.1